MKYVSVNGVPVVAADEVADAALQRTHYIVSHLFAGRPDIVQDTRKSKPCSLARNAFRDYVPISPA